MSSVRCRGVAANAAKSLCVIAETLYYLSPDGVMAWSGSLPAKVSGALDTGKLTAVDRAVGGQLDARYYLYLHRKRTRAAGGCWCTTPSGACGRRRARRAPGW